MFFLQVIVFACLATAYAKEEQAEKVQEKRGALQYSAATAKYVTATEQAEPNVAYATAKVTQQQYIPTKTVQSAPQPQYISQQGLKYTNSPATSQSTAPQQFEYEQQQQVQTVTYLQQPTTKLTAAKVS